MNPMTQVPSTSQAVDAGQSTLVNRNSQWNGAVKEDPQSSTGAAISGTSALDPEFNQIQTFVFFDLETSGVGGVDCRILELTMVAVSRKDLLSMVENHGITIKNTPAAPLENTANVCFLPKLPRVLHKYTRLYYPRKIISPLIEDITGLNNDILHRLPGFSRSSAEALDLFLDLPKPVSLVAHNGKRFDFPLLRAELENVLDNFSDLKSFLELQCTDSLLAFREIDANLKVEEELKDISEITNLAESFTFNDMDDEELMDLAPDRKKPRGEINREDQVDDASRRVSTPPSPAHIGHLEVSAELHVTPVKEQPLLAGTPKTPAKSSIPNKFPVTPETNSPKPMVNGTSTVRRNLTYGSGKRKWDGTQPYKQVNLYKRLFGREYDAHRAEADCIALLEICGFYSERFVEWADRNCYKFSDQKSMWKKRKSFKMH